MLDDLGAGARSVTVPALSAPAAQQYTALTALALMVLRQRLGWLVLSGLLGVLATLWLLTLASPRYNSHAELLVDPRELRIFDNQVTPTTVASDTGIALVESQTRVLGSDNVLRRVIDKLDLANDPEFNGTPRSTVDRVWARISNLQLHLGNKDNRADATEAALDKLARQIYVRRPERTYVMELTASAESREKAVAITEAIIAAYLTDLSQARDKVTAAAGASIDARLEALRNNVNQSEAKVAKYKTDNNLMATGGVLVNEQQLTEINKQLVQAQTDSARAKSRYEEMQGSIADPASSPEAVNSATLRNLKAQLSTISAQQQQLGVDLLPNHPSMRAIAAEARTVRTQMTMEMKNLLEASRHDYERAKAAEDSLNNTLQDLRKQLVTTSDAQIGLRELQRELDANQSIYQLAIVRVREAREQEGVDTTNVRVISPAIADRTPSFPPSKRLLLPTAFLTMFGMAWLGFLVFGGHRQTASSIRSAKA